MNGKALVSVSFRALGRRTKLNRLVRNGDLANRRRSWRRAEKAYSAALAIQPSLKHIWVQYGHALKEQGRLESAEAAYRRSLELDNMIADTYVQLGHVLKLQERFDEAIAAYQRAHRLDPTLDQAADDLRELGLAVAVRGQDWFEPDRAFIGEVYGEAAGSDAWSPADHGIGQAAVAGGVRYVSREHLLRTHWLADDAAEIFDFLHYFHANPSVARELVRAHPLRCLIHFCEHGISAVLQCSADLRFDPEFYTETYLGGRAVPPAVAYRHWLNNGYKRGLQPNKACWLQRHLEHFLVSTSPGFDFELRKIAVGRREPAVLWTDWLRRFTDKDVLRPAAHLPITADTAPFFCAIADRFAVNGNDDHAAIIYQRVLHAVPTHSPSMKHYADCLLRCGKFVDATKLYNKIIDSGEFNTWSFAHLATCHTEQGELRQALWCLDRGIRAFPGDPILRLEFDHAADRFFDGEWQSAVSAGMLGRYDEAHERLRDTCSLLSSLMQADEPLPRRPIGSPAVASGGSIAIVSVTTLPQCHLYRVEQKAEHLRAAGYDVLVYNGEARLAVFVTEVHLFDAVIFYRLPTQPSVLRAMAKAKAVGLTTFYDIDDFIFGGDDYPGSFESFKGLITKKEYVGLKLAIPLWQHAMSLCDFGIASTPALAKELAKFIPSGKVFLHRNAFGSRHEQASLMQKTKSHTDKVTIFYGSGTKSHKQDFEELLEPALIEMVRRHGDNVEIVLVGYMALSDRLNSIRSKLRIIEPIWDLEAYWSVLRTADINLAVLKDDTPLAQCKSELKWLEAAMFDIPSVVSGTTTYREVIEHGVTGLICDTPEEWIDALDLMVRDGGLRQRIGSAAGRKVRERYAVAVAAENIRRILGSVSPPQPSLPKPTVVIVNVYYPPQAIGGATRIVHDNVKHFVEKYAADFSVEVFTTAAGAEEDYQTSCFVQDGVRVTAVARPEAAEPVDEGMGDKFASFLDKVRPTLVHFHCIQHLTISVVSAVRERRIPYVITVHDGWWISSNQFITNRNDRPELYNYLDPFSVIPALGKPAYRRMLQLKPALFDAYKILAVSKKFADLYKSCGVPNVITVENGIANLPTANRSPSPDGRVRLGMLGGIAERAKGYQRIECAFMGESFAHLRLIAIDHSLECGASRREVWNGTPVEFLPKFPESQVAALYEMIDVVLAPSVWAESFGLVTREALHFGCWVIASDRGSIGDCVTEDENGHVVDVSDATDLIRVLKLIDENPQRYRHPPKPPAMLRKAVQQADELAELYNSMIELRARPQIIFGARDQAMREGLDFVVSVARPQIICDIGSFNGDEAVHLGSISPRSRVFAFEANKDNFDSFLIPKIAESGVTNVTAEHLAICDTVGTVDFHVVAPDSHLPLWRRMAGSLLERHNDPTPYMVKTVAATTLDEYFANDLDSTFVLWIDVEGALDRIINGANRVLSRTIAFRAEVERQEFWNNQALAAEMMKQIEELGFVVLFDTNVDGTLPQSDILFLNLRWRDLICGGPPHSDSPARAMRPMSGLSNKVQSGAGSQTPRLIQEPMSMNFIPFQAATRRDKLLTANIDPPTQTGIEIGALNNPVIRPIHGNVRFIDRTDNQGLREKFAEEPEVVASMVEVDYVWAGAGSLREVIGTEEFFDWAIASHVIEHVPNMLGWLRAIGDVLKPGGVINLAIPDRRFTFDVRCSESTLGELVEADLLNYKVPSIRQVFDNCYYGKAIDPGALWHETIDVDALPQLTGHLATRLAYDSAVRIRDSNIYYDSHCWIFTPLSFLGLMQGAADLGLLTLIPAAFYPTEIGDFEFFASLRRPAFDVAPDKLKMEQIAALARIRADLEQGLRKAKLISSV